jgi:hypothetical protein
MLNKLSLMTAVAALAITPALAQTTAPSGQSPDTSAPSAQSTTPPPASTNTQAATDGAMFVDAQTSDQWLASDLIGVTVTNNGNEKIGDVNDLLVDKSGNVMAAIIGVGGFLGIGEKDVAVSMKSLNISRDGDTDKVTANLSKEQLQQAAAFKEYQPPRQTSGTAPAGRPSGGATPPATTR